MKWARYPYRQFSPICYDAHLIATVESAYVPMALTLPVNFVLNTKSQRLSLRLLTA